MNTRRQFLFNLGAGLLLTGRALAQTAPAGAALPTPSQVVQQYLKARAARDYAQAYAQFSATVQQQIPFAQFADGKDFPGAAAHADEDGVSPLMMALSALFMDSHNQAGYRFTVLGPDPSDTHIVLVRARPEKAPSSGDFLLKIGTAPDADGIPRIELLPSYQKTGPADMTRMRRKAEDVVSLSNLRQISLAILMYAQDHQERMPDAARWVDQISPYLGDQTASPAKREQEMALLFHDPLAPADQKWNYAFNRNLSRLPLSSLKNPATTVLVFESKTGTKNASDTGQSIPHPGRHNDGDYYAFADGHVKWASDKNDPALLKTWLSFSPQGAAPSP